MKSTEKVWALIEHLQASEDDELAEAVPIRIPPLMLRSALTGATAQLPQDPAELDGFLAAVADFCLNLRSDDAPALAV